ncbi:MAG: HigA family addiction module antidote protein [Alcanivoracaceae bacterium]|nr:HigA family addiction module antidote protein [Alcanivoracaceae bacterium]
MIRNPNHPGVFLQIYLDDYNITAYKLAKDTFMPQTRVSEILKGKRSITLDTSLRLSKYFGNSIEQWLNLQRSYDLFKLDKKPMEEIKPLAKTG